MPGHLSVIPSRALDDPKVGNAALRCLLVLGTYTDRNGWCRVKQSTIGERLKVDRRAVSKQLQTLIALGYVEDHRTGRSSRYRVLLDVPAGPEIDLMPPEGASDAPPGGGIHRTTFLNDQLPPNPPQSGGRASTHDGSHRNCRACGTNRRGPKPPTASERAAQARAEMDERNRRRAAGDVCETCGGDEWIDGDEALEPCPTCHPSRRVS